MQIYTCRGRRTLLQPVVSLPVLEQARESFLRHRPPPLRLLRPAPRAGHSRAPSCSRAQTASSAAMATSIWLSSGTRVVRYCVHRPGAISACAQALSRLRPAHFSISKAMPGDERQQQQAQADGLETGPIPSEKAWRGTTEKTTMDVISTMKIKLVPQRGWIRLACGRILQRHRQARFQCVDGLVLRAVVLEDALDVLHLRDGRMYRKKMASRTAAFGQVGRQPPVAGQEVVGQQGGQGPEQAKAEDQRDHGRQRRWRCR